MSKNMKDMKRSEIRYRLFRLRTELEPGGVAYDLEKSVKKYFEADPNYTSFKQFAKTWDIEFLDDKWRIVRREESVEDEWDRTVRKLAKTFKK